MFKSLKNCLLTDDTVACGKHCRCSDMTSIMVEIFCDVLLLGIMRMICCCILPHHDTVCDLNQLPLRFKYLNVATAILQRHFWEIIFKSRDSNLNPHVDIDNIFHGSMWSAGKYSEKHASQSSAYFAMMATVPTAARIQTLWLHLNKGIATVFYWQWRSVANIAMNIDSRHGWCWWTAEMMLIYVSSEDVINIGIC